MITKEEYLKAKSIVDEYEKCMKEQQKLPRVKLSKYGLQSHGKRRSIRVGVLLNKYKLGYNDYGVEVSWDGERGTSHLNEVEIEYI